MGAMELLMRLLFLALLMPPLLLPSMPLLLQLPQPPMALLLQLPNLLRQMLQLLRLQKPPLVLLTRLLLVDTASDPEVAAAAAVAAAVFKEPLPYNERCIASAVSSRSA